MTKYWEVLKIRRGKSVGVYVCATFPTKLAPMPPTSLNFDIHVHTSNSQIMTCELKS